MSRTLGTRTPTHPITGEPLKHELSVTLIEVLRAARDNGWNVGPIEKVSPWADSIGLYSDDASVPAITLTIENNKVTGSNASKPERTLLLLEGKCSCDGHPRDGGWGLEGVTDELCEVHA